jgi:N-acetylglucosamine-6-phosphate deacetylase
VRRLAAWGGLVAASIAAATLAPRRLLGERQALEQLLLGRPLADTLRWSTATDGHLSWRRPAAVSGGSEAMAGGSVAVPQAPAP